MSKEVALALLSALLKNSDSIQGIDSDSDGATLMRWAVEEGDVSALQALARLGVDISMPFEHLSRGGA
jgi:hypothetical protein